MGILDFVDVFDVRDSELGQSRPVGIIENVVPTSATKICKSPDDDRYGGYVFGAEIPLNYVQITRLGQQPSVAIRRQEFKSVPGDPDQQIKDGARLIVAQAPHSGYWVVVKPFRRWRERRPDVLESAENPLVLTKAVEDSDRDLFESRKGIMTAAIEEDDYRVFLRMPARAQYKGLRHVLGIVQDIGGEEKRYAAIETEIFNSPRLQSTVKAVAKGAPLGPNKDLFLPHRLRDDLDSLMFYSIRQALAGPGAEKNPEEFKGEPVGLYARHLFMDHAYNLTRSAPETRHEVFAYIGAKDDGDAVRDQMARFLALYFDDE